MSKCLRTPDALDMEANPDDLTPTRSSLVNRLKDWGDRDSWREFYGIYRRLIFGAALKAGLTEREAEEVVQETVISVAKTMNDFKYDRKRCTFKSWLLHLTQKQIAESFQKRPDKRTRKKPPTGIGYKPPPIKREVGPEWLDLEGIWEEEWRQKVLDAAVERVRGSVDPAHYQMFDLFVKKKLPAREVAAALGANIGQVYLAKHRVSKLIKREVQSLETRML